MASIKTDIPSRTRRTKENREAKEKCEEQNNITNVLYKRLHWDHPRYVGLEKSAVHRIGQSSVIPMTYRLSQSAGE